jgi:HPt (histidine-containing phosphotransfer) domain-containing protein
MIDWTRVDALRDEIGAEGFIEVVELFLDEADEAVGRLADAPAGALEADLHFLRGSALNLGLDALARLCDAGERAAANGNAAAVDRTLILRVYGESRAAFLDGIAAPAPQRAAV